VVVRPEVNGDIRPPWIANSCWCNEMRALKGRVLKAVPQPTIAGIERLHNVVTLLVKVLRGRQRQGVIGRTVRDFGQAPYQSVYSHHVGAKKTRYINAHQDILREGPSLRKDARITMFVKAEKSWVEPKDPRAIQFRSVKYTLELGSFMKPIEGGLYALKSLREFRVARATRIVAKGLNQQQRAALLRDKADQFAKPMFIGLDCKRFDQHVSTEQLERVEHALYLGLNPSPRFAKLLSWQLINEGKSLHGIKYKVLGRRMSGDYGTALGNCVTMISMIIAAARQVRLIRYDLVDDGDDCVLIIEDEDLQKVLEMFPRLFLEFGHELTIESVTPSLCDVVFCQTRPTYCSDGVWRMIRDYRKVVAVGGASHDHYDNWRGGRKVMKAVGQCELALNRGVPVLQEYALGLIRLAGDVQAAKAIDRLGSVAYKASFECPLTELSSLKPITISDTCRAMFELNWGCTVEEQLRLEEEFRGWVAIPPDTETIMMDRLTVAGEGDSFAEFPWPIDFDVYSKPGVDVGELKPIHAGSTRTYK